MEGYFHLSKHVTYDIPKTLQHFELMLVAVSQLNI
jgi:hypothetical protein